MIIFTYTANDLMEMGRGVGAWVDQRIETLDDKLRAPESKQS
jgi:hypothetical protein